MRIVVLDSEPALGCRTPHSNDLLSPISDGALRALGELETFRTTAPSDTVTRCQGASVVLTNKVVLGKAEFEQLPELRLVSVLATGVNVIDLDAARRASVTVCNVPGYSTASTAQHVFALILELCNQVGLHARSVRDGDWAKSETFSYFRTPLRELQGLTLGVVGLGAIGTRVAAIAQAMGMTVIARTRTPKQVPGVTAVSLSELLGQSDIVTLHCPLTEETKQLINEQAIARMKTGALLINCSRGPVLDQHAVADALHSGKLGGAGLDVLEVEPPGKDNPLLSAPKCLITPHIAWASEEARKRLLAITAANIAGFLAGTPQNVVAGPE